MVAINHKSTLREPHGGEYQISAHKRQLEYMPRDLAMLFYFAMPGKKEKTTFRASTNSSGVILRVLPWISWLYFHASVPIADMPNNHEINTSASEVMMAGVFRPERRCTTNRRTKKTKTNKFSVQVIPNIPSADIGTSPIIEFVIKTR